MYTDRAKRDLAHKEVKALGDLKNNYEKLITKVNDVIALRRGSFAILNNIAGDFNSCGGPEMIISRDIVELDTKEFEAVNVNKFTQEAKALLSVIEDQVHELLD